MATMGGEDCLLLPPGAEICFHQSNHDEGLKYFEHFQKVPLSNRWTEVQRTATELNTSLPKEAEPLQQRVRFSSSTSSGAGDQVDLIGSEIQCSSQAAHGDSGVEADLSALNLYDEDGETDHLAQELGEGTTACEKSIDLTASKGQGTQDSGKAGQRDCGESPIQTCQKRKGRGVKKEVMMSFGMVKCDGGVRQKNVKKEGEQMKADGRSPGH